MAGAGYRTFTAGQILTAAQVQEFLQDQSVMVFDDSAARSSALGTFVAEGMLTYLKDTNSLEYYDSAAFQPVTDQAIRKDFLDASGVLITSSASGVPSLISIGTAGQVLTVVGTAPAWADAGGGGGGGFNTVTQISATDAAYSVPAATSNIFKFTLVGGGGGGWTHDASGGGSGGSTILSVGGTAVGTAVGGGGGYQNGRPSPPTFTGGSAQVWAADNGGAANFSPDNARPGSGGRGGQVRVVYQDLDGISTINATIGAAGNASSNDNKGGTGLILMEYSA